MVLGLIIAVGILSISTIVAIMVAVRIYRKYEDTKLDVDRTIERVEKLLNGIVIKMREKR